MRYCIYNKGGGTNMDYDKIILDMLNRIVKLEEKVEWLSNNAQANDAELPTGSKKYFSRKFSFC